MLRARKGESAWIGAERMGSRRTKRVIARMDGVYFIFVCVCVCVISVSNAFWVD